MRSLLFKFNKNTLFSPPSSTNPIQFGPFNSFIQRRWEKPADTAQTRLENRWDLKLDKLTTHIRKLKTALHLFDLMSKRRGPFVSVQIMSRWVDVVGLNVSMGDFLQKHSHVFEVFTHPLKKNVSCRVIKRMLSLIQEEKAVIRESELENVRRLRKLLMMSKNGTLTRFETELGLPEDFRESMLSKYSDDFKLVHLKVVALVKRDEDLAVAEVEKWGEREYKERWLSEFETKYTFPINFPTGSVIEKGFRVEKMMDVERFAHFRKDLGTEVNVHELLFLLKHPGIFYISTKGNTQTIFLREAYNKGYLSDPNPIYIVQRKMLDLMLLGRCNTKELKSERASGGNGTDIVANKSMDGTRDGEWILPLLEGSDD
ncbi:hypothetical protein Cgig2_005159 [Carnegiea gigantea]|uniref:PORR domain-containing protein n=1 Tax=Carnegiea gigantea TaxID=171969 RepID=A0A9Q1KEW3_9CARY|nr:hypothetical protein Cgig2_005159 [Carnegiea gigantea]